MEIFWRESEAYLTWSRLHHVSKRAGEYLDMFRFRKKRIKSRPSHCINAVCFFPELSTFTFLSEVLEYCHTILNSTL